MIARSRGPRSERKPTSLGTRSILVHVTLALLALLILVLVVLLWRAVTRERRDYARFKRLRSTTLRRKVFRRWILESWLVLGGLAAVVLLAASPFVPLALEDAAPVGSARRRSRTAGHRDADSSSDSGSPPSPCWCCRSCCCAAARRDAGDRRHPRAAAPQPRRAAVRRRARADRGHRRGAALPARAARAAVRRAPAAGRWRSGSRPCSSGCCTSTRGRSASCSRSSWGCCSRCSTCVSGSILAPIVLHALIDLRSLVLIPIALGGAWGSTRPLRGLLDRPLPPLPQATRRTVST